MPAWLVWRWWLCLLECFVAHLKPAGVLCDPDTIMKSASFFAIIAANDGWMVFCIQLTNATE